MMKKGEGDHFSENIRSSFAAHELTRTIDHYFLVLLVCCRLQGILSFVGGVGVLLFALPNFLYPMEEDVTSSTNDNQTQQSNQLCNPGERNF